MPLSVGMERWQSWLNARDSLSIGGTRGISPRTNHVFALANKYMIERIVKIEVQCLLSVGMERWQSWLNARDSKSCILVYSIGGSNPFLSARNS